MSYSSFTHTRTHTDTNTSLDRITWKGRKRQKGEGVGGEEGSLRGCVA